jgi:geranylgeranyl pyrophosphate synthase
LRAAALLDDPTDEHVTVALELLRSHPALDLARDAARLEAAQAKQALERLSPDGAGSPALTGLAFLADHAASRAA